MAMQVSMSERVALMSREFVRRYWDGDETWCCERVRSDVVMLLPDEEAPAVGVEEFRRAIERLSATNPRVILLNESYSVIPCGDDTFCASGICVAYIGGSGDGMLEATLRASLMWVLALDGSFQMAHGHFSTCAKNAPSQGAPDLASAPEADEPMMRLVKNTAADTGNIMVFDEAGTAHYLNGHDIRYLEADRRKTIVHHRTGTLCVCHGIGELGPKMGSAFVAVHRSYLVNALFIESISYKGCVLSDGTVLPVPSRRLAEIREEIARVRA